NDLNTAKIIYLILLVNLSFSFFVGAFNAYIQALQKFRFLNLVQLIRVLIRVTVLVILLSLGYKAITVVIVDTLINLCLGIIFYLFSKYKLKMVIRFNGNDKSLLKEITSYSSFVFISSISDLLFWR